MYNFSAGKDGSHGLDLSFSTHLFLLEGVWNSSLESQIVSRAHRMGATGSVKVREFCVEIFFFSVLKRGSSALFIYIFFELSNRNHTAKGHTIDNEGYN